MAFPAFGGGSVAGVSEAGEVMATVGANAAGGGSCPETGLPVEDLGRSARRAMAAATLLIPEAAEMAERLTTRAAKIAPVLIRGAE